jgi:hypothetical protein
MALPAQSAPSSIPRSKSVENARLAVAGRRAPLNDSVGLELERACREAAVWSRAELLALAIARGCFHYAAFWPQLPAVRGGLPHEVLGCALLRGPAEVETFQAIRCAAMVLSDWHNDPEVLGEAAVRLDVAGRVAHLAELGWRYDSRPEYWAAVLAGLPEGLAEEDFLPGVSRLSCETFESATSRSLARTWLRTDFVR